MPQIPAVLLRAGGRRPGGWRDRRSFHPIQQRLFGQRVSGNGKQRDFSLSSPLVTLFLGLLLVSAGLYGFFLGMSEQEALPALAPVGEGRDEAMDFPGGAASSPTWKDRLRGLIGPGLRMAARELWTSALATALPGLLRVGPEQVMSTESSPVVGGLQGWLAALTGIDVSSPESILNHTLPGFRIRDYESASLLATQLPARGGNGMMGSTARDNTTVGAGGEWPLPEVLPSSFLAVPTPVWEGAVAPSAGLSEPVEPNGRSTVSASQVGAVRDSKTTDGTGGGTKGTATGSREPGPAVGREIAPGGDDVRNPLVLIYHTHTAESYHTPGRQAEKDHYEWNSTNSGVIQVGKEIVATLRAAGISAIHTPRVNDYPEFGRAYSNSRQLVREYLQKYPSIVVALDIHRDGKEYTPDTVNSQGTRIARIAFVVGTNTGALANPHWSKNLAFAQELHQALEKLQPGVSRGIMLREDARFNQDLLPGLLVVEVGTYTNELAEARAAGRLLGRALAEILNRP